MKNQKGEIGKRYIEKRGNKKKGGNEDGKGRIQARIQCIWGNFKKVGTGNEENREMDKGKGGMVEVKERENKKKERKGNRKG